MAQLWWRTAPETKKSDPGFPKIEHSGWRRKNRPLATGKWLTKWASTAGKHDNNTDKKKDLKQNNKIQIQIINIDN